MPTMFRYGIRAKNKVIELDKHVLILVPRSTELCLYLTLSVQFANICAFRDGTRVSYVSGRPKLGVCLILLYVLESSFAPFAVNPYVETRQLSFWVWRAYFLKGNFLCAM